MRTTTTRSHLIVALVLTAVALPACGGSSSLVSARPDATTSPTANMTRVAAVRAVAESGTSGPVTATAACPDGQVMLGGGYARAGDVRVQRAAVIEDYPSSARARTVTAINATAGGPLTLTV
jgi:hypothetical protein